MKIANQENSVDKRIKPRKPSSESIFFTSKNGFYEGRLNNFSRYGLFIETTASLCVGEIITIASAAFKWQEDKVQRTNHMA